MKVTITPKMSDRNQSRSFVDPVGAGVSEEQMQKLRDHLRRMGKCVRCGTPLQRDDLACRSCGLDRAGQAEDIGIFLGSERAADRSKEQEHSKFQPKTEAPSSPPPIDPIPDSYWESTSVQKPQEESGYTGSYHAEKKPEEPLSFQEHKELPDTKLCPYCSEVIKYTAIKCKHCGEFFEKRAKPVTREPAPKLLLTKEEKPNEIIMGVIGLALLLLFAAALISELN